MTQATAACGHLGSFGVLMESAFCAVKGHVYLVAACTGSLNVSTCRGCLDQCIQPAAYLSHLLQFESETYPTLKPSRLA